MSPVAILVIAAILGACGPVGMSDDEVHVTGTIEPGGRCVVQTPRGDLRTRDSGRVFYEVGGIMNAAPPGYIVHILGCGVPAGDSARYSQREHAFRLWFAVRAGGHLSPGRYSVEDLAVTAGKSQAAEASLQDSIYDVGTPGAGVGVVASVLLHGTRGVVELLEIEVPDSVDGANRVAHPVARARFDLHMRRRWSW